MLRTYLLAAMIFILLLTQAACSRESILSPYLAPDEVTYSMIFLVHSDEWDKETNTSLQLYREHMKDFSQVGVIEDDSKDGKTIAKALNIKQYPAYMIFDHKKVRVLTDDFEDFENQMKNLLNQPNSSM